MPTNKKTVPAKKISKEIKKPKVLEVPTQNTEYTETTTNGNVITKQEHNNQKNILIVLWVILVAIIIAILLFSQKQTIPWVSHLKENTTSWVISWVVKSWDKIKVDYVWKLEDWTIFDSSLEEFAKKMKNYSANSGRKYEPLEFTVWAGQMIKWFDAWVIGMKVGEKKTLTIAPADAYWEAKISQTIPSKYLSDNIEQDVPADSFKDVVSKTFPIEALGEKWKNIKVWQDIEESWVSWKVTAITASGVTLEIKNAENPFTGKEIVVWATADYQWNTITIKKITPENITVNILNKQSPFFGKKLIEWLVGKLPNWQEIKIVKITPENTEVETTNPHELAGKTLIFDIELKEIVK